MEDEPEQAPGGGGHIIAGFEICLRLLSIAVCVLDARDTAAGATGSVYIWRYLPLTPEDAAHPGGPFQGRPTLDQITPLLFLALDELMDELEGMGTSHIDCVLIENQPSRPNGMYRQVQMMIYSYFQLRAHWEGQVSKVQMMSSFAKLQGHAYEIGAAPSSKFGYALHRWRAVAHILCYMGGDETLRRFFQGVKKKGELAGAALMAISYARRNGIALDRIESRTL